MMQSSQNYSIQEVPLSSSFFRREVERFLTDNGLRLESLDAYYAIRNSEGRILAGAGLQGRTIKCVAVAAQARSEGLAAPLISHIISESGSTCLRVFTKPEHQSVFESLGFKLLASAPEAVLMENGRGVERYCAYLQSLPLTGKVGVVLMHANPFTLGHRHLLEKAQALVDTLVVIPVKEDSRPFSYSERLQMLRAGVPEGVVVAEGSDYQISSLTFPTYFLKDLSTAAENQMRLDLDLFRRWIAPALGAVSRFVGTEPLDPLTARYNSLMKELLPLEVVEIPRLEDAGGPVSASRVRKALEEGSFEKAAALVPAGSRPYLLAQLACQALQTELDLPLKPGLVCPGFSGAHKDMDYALMQRSIAALRPWFVRMASAQNADELQQLGMEAEESMLEATGGVNTHRGAIFCLGLALYAWAQTPDNQELPSVKLASCAQLVLRKRLSGSDLTPRGLSHGELAAAQFHAKGAREMALDGYWEVFQDWLPYYRSLPKGTEAMQRTLLRIMSTLDDTCILHRAGLQRAQQVKEEAKELAHHFDTEKLKTLCDRYAEEGISPGGAADMLSLTLLLNTFIN